MCWKCGNNTNSIQIFRTTTCPSCGSDLHSCYNCKFYSSGSHYDCKETNADLVTDKERANFCDYFLFLAKKEEGQFPLPTVL